MCFNHKKSLLCLNQSEDFFQTADLGYSGISMSLRVLLRYTASMPASDRTEYIGTARRRSSVSSARALLSLRAYSNYSPLLALRARTASDSTTWVKYCSMLELRSLRYWTSVKPLEIMVMGKWRAVKYSSNSPHVRHEYGFAERISRKIRVHIPGHFVRLNACMAEQMTESLYNQIIRNQALSILWPQLQISTGVEVKNVEVGIMFV